LGLFLLAACFLLCNGCGPSRPKTAPVTGRITFEGDPVTAGKIVFYPEEGRAAIGSIAADGTYRLTTFDPDDGAVLGNHRVTIRATRVAESGMPATFEDELKGIVPGPPPDDRQAVTWLVPESYSRRETSPLTAVVKPGPNTIDFDLPLEEGTRD